MMVHICGRVHSDTSTEDVSIQQIGGICRENIGSALKAGDFPQKFHPHFLGRVQKSKDTKRAHFLVLKDIEGREGVNLKGTEDTLIITSRESCYYFPLLQSTETVVHTAYHTLSLKIFKSNRY